MIRFSPSFVTAPVPTTYTVHSAVGQSPYENTLCFLVDSM